jgi:tetratricopeptide (TPR) repeat protein
MAILSSSGVAAFYRYFEDVWIRRCVVGMMSMLMAITVWDMIRLHPNQYVYFNRLVAGGLAEASKGYQTDYWENSYKQGVRWLDKHYQPEVGRRLRVGGASDNVQYLLDASRYEFVPVPEPALMDVYMSTTRADGHRMVPGEVIKTIDQDGVPLLYIIRPDSTYNSNPFFMDHVDRLFKLAWLYDKINDLQAAITGYEEIVDLGHGSVVVYNNLSENHIRLGYFEKGEYFIRKALALDVTDAKAHLRLGMSLVYQNRQKEAESEFQKALALAPDMIVIYRNYIALLVAMERWGEVGSLADKAFVLNPLDEQIWYFLAQSQRHQGKLEEAYNSIARAISVSPSKEKYRAEYINIGSSFFSENKFDRALEIYGKIIQLDSENPIVHFNSGIVLSELGREKEAADAFRKAMELNPEDTGALIKFGNLSEKLNRHQDAVWAYEKLLKFFSENQELRSRIQLLQQKM